MKVMPLVLLLSASSALAQDATQRERAAIPFLMQEIGNKAAQWAVCLGDLQAVQSQLAEARKQIDEMKSARDQAK